MKSRRWHGSGVVLRDGRIFTPTGHEYQRIVHLGGRRGGGLPSSPQAHYVDRFARSDDESL